MKKYRKGSIEVKLLGYKSICLGVYQYKKRPHLSARLTGILSLLHLLVALLVSFVVAPEGKGLGAERAGDGPAAAEVLAVLVGPEVRALGVGAAQRTSRV